MEALPLFACGETPVSANDNQAGTPGRRTAAFFKETLIQSTGRQRTAGGPAAFKAFQRGPGGQAPRGIGLAVPEGRLWILKAARLPAGKVPGR